MYLLPSWAEMSFKVSAIDHKQRLVLLRVAKTMAILLFFRGLFFGKAGAYKYKTAADPDFEANLGWAIYTTTVG